MTSEFSVLNIHGRNVSLRRLGKGQRKIILFHGFPGSSAQILPFAPYVDELDLEVISLDRPGYNQTEKHSANQFLQVTQDIMSVCELLGWKSCEVVSVSGGTPFLFSFVKAYPGFVTNMTVVSGLGPIATVGFSSAVTRKSKLALQFLPFLPGSVFRKIAQQAKSGRSSKFNVIRFMLPSSPADLAALQNLSKLRVLNTALQEAFKQSGLGPKSDAKAYRSRWSTELPEYRCPVSIWHGAEDMILNSSMAKLMAQSLPQARLYVVPNEGHYSLAFNHIGDILKTE